MPPGQYLQKRRLAAGLTIDDVAKLLSPNGRFVPYWQERIRAFEADIDVVAQLSLVALRGVFAFKPEIYLAMVMEQPHGEVCRSCGCSMFDPCQEAPGVPCGWAEPDLCTACANNQIVRPALVPSEPMYELCASDPFAARLLTMLGQIHLRQWPMVELSASKLLRDLHALSRRHDQKETSQAIGEEALSVAAAMATWRMTTLGTALLPQEGSPHA